MREFVVIDASVAVKWVVPEEETDLARKLYGDAQGSDTTLLVPPHFSIEVTNALRKKTWRDEITPVDATQALQTFLDFTFSMAEPPGLYQRALQLANLYNRRAVYDSHYVALAAIFGCDFWTADSNLVNVMASDMPFIRLLKNYEKETPK